jgi:hypothetical protein
MSTIDWKNRMTWYNIIQYCVPNNRWMMFMLSLMSGESWWKLNSNKRCKKKLVMHRRDEAAYKRHNCLQ